MLTNFGRTSRRFCLCLTNSQRHDRRHHVTGELGALLGVEVVPVYRRSQVSRSLCYSHCLTFSRIGNARTAALMGMGNILSVLIKVSAAGKSLFSLTYCLLCSSSHGLLRCMPCHGAVGERNHQDHARYNDSRVYQSARSFRGQTINADFFGRVEEVVALTDTA